MSEIQSLSEQVQRAAASYSWWNKGSQFFIGATAIVAVMYFIFSGIALIKSGGLNRLQNELSKTKDDQLAQDLKDKDKKIADTQKEAQRIEAAANEKIAETNKEAKRIESEAQQETARLTAEAEKAREGIAKAQQEAAIANAEAANANERAEKEALKRTEFARSLSRRVLTRVNEGALFNFRGTEAVVEYLPETEPFRAAMQIRAALERAGWKILDFRENKNLMDERWDGVTIQMSPPTPPLFKGITQQQREKRIEDWRASMDAMDGVVGFLKSNNWQARGDWGEQGKGPPRGVKIIVGLKPEPRIFTEQEEKYLTGNASPDEAPLPKQRTVPRHLTPAQRDALTNRLKQETKMFPFGNENPFVSIVCPADNSEACAFAREIEECFRSAEWPWIGDVVPLRDFPRRLVGLDIKVNWKNQTTTEMALRRAFDDSEIGITIPWKADREYTTPGTPLQLMVGW